MIHKIKINKPYADAVLDGRKTFEVRLNDRGYQVGDMVKFTVIDNGLLDRSHKLNDRFYEITYVLSGWGIKNGYVVFGIKESEENE